MPPRFSPPMGNFALPPFTRGVKWLLIATVALSILVPISGAFGENLAALFAFVPGGLRYGHVWQPLTYTSSGALVAKIECAHLDRYW